MFAIIGAVLFGLALIFDLGKVGLGDVVSSGTLVEAGLLCLALHLAGVATSTRWRGFARRR